MRVVVDTNVWVSALVNPHGAPARIRTALREQRFDFITSEPLLRELAEVLGRPRFARVYRIAPEDVGDLLTLLRERGKVVEIVDIPRWCRDPDDDLVIATALRGRANVLVTRDDDLKGVAELAGVLHEQGVDVLSVRRFLESIAPGQTPQV